MIYVYIYIHTHIHKYIYIYIHDIYWIVSITLVVFYNSTPKQVQGLGGTFFPTSGGFDGDSPP